MNSVRGWKTSLSLSYAFWRLPLRAQTFTTLDTGVSSSAPLVQAIDGNLYGSNLTGGSVGHGTIFKIMPDGMLSTVHNFVNQAAGVYPTGLSLALNGSLYGTTGAKRDPIVALPVAVRGLRHRVWLHLGRDLFHAAQV